MPAVREPALIHRWLPTRPFVAALLAACALGLSAAPPALANGSPSPRAVVAQRACTAITTHAGEANGAPEFLASYVFPNGREFPELQTVAYTYDNALAVIALIACHRLPQAERIGAALRTAALTDPRLRNGYRAGPITSAPLTNGWWDPTTHRWLEDSYQSGTATGNVAWAALAMLALNAATGDPRWRTAAVHLAHWIDRNTRYPAGHGGFTGGIDGFDSSPKKIEWQSTEHNIDAVALFTWLAEIDPAPEWTADAATARQFVASQWNAKAGYFLIGTLPNGAENTGASALDVQAWAQLLPAPDPDWQRALHYAAANYKVGHGFAFGSARGGVWLEGTAQTALAYRHVGMNPQADELFPTIAGQFSPSGYVYATNQKELRTSPATAAGNSGPGYYYFRLPHLGATAWAALAALDWNPFTCHAGKRKAACKH